MSNPTEQDHAQQKSAEDLAAQLAETAKRLGADLSDATVGLSRSLTAKARDGKVEDVTQSSSKGAAIRVIKDGRLGFATSAAAPRNRDEAEALCARALALAEIATPNDANVMLPSTAPTGDELAAHVAALQLYHGDVATLTPAWAVEKAIAMERCISATEGIKTVRECAAYGGTHSFALATADGFRGSYSGTSAQLYASAVAADGDKNQVDGWWTVSRSLHGLDDAEAVARVAAERVKRRCGAKKLKSQSVPVIFDPMMARTFVGAVLSAINGERVAKNASFLAGKKGEQVFISGAALKDDPSQPGGLGSRPFDGEAQKNASTTLIDDAGVLQSYLLDARSAHELKDRAPGHAGRGATSLPGPTVSNVRLQGGAGDLEKIIADTPRGLLVTHMMGHSPDLITGEYSRGAAGFWIEEGRIAYPVEEITVAGDMLTMMTRIDKVGTDHDLRSSVQVPTIRFAELSVSGA